MSGPAGPNLLDAQEDGRRGSPAMVAIRHLRQRKIAMVCFVMLVGYFGTAAISYVRFPDKTVAVINEDGSESDETRTIKRAFIGEWFEELATRRLVGPDEVTLEYQPPQFGAPDLTTLKDRGYTRGDVALWEAIDDKPATEASGFHFIFGTDVQGRSVFWLTLYSARSSMTIAFGAALLVVLIGTTLGAIAGYFGGLADAVITWLFTTVASIPRILLVLAMAYALRDFEFSLPWKDDPVRVPGIAMLILAMGLTTWVGLCRLIRGEVMKLKELDYESAARALGLSRPRILAKHLVPNVLYLVIIQFSLIFPLFIHLEVILTYLGIGGDIKASWGQMIEASLQEMMRSPVVWWQLAAATMAVFGVSLALNLFGDALRDALDPKLQQSNN